MTESHSDGPLLFTMRELHNDTAAIMEALNTQNRSAVITRRGRPVALVQPLANVENLEGKAIRAAVEAGDIDLDGGDKSSTLKELREASLDDDSAT